MHKLLTVNEAARREGLTSAAIRTRVYEKTLSHVMVDGKIGICPAALKAWRPRKVGRKQHKRGAK